MDNPASCASGTGVGWRWVYGVNNLQEKWLPLLGIGTIPLRFLMIMKCIFDPLSATGLTWKMPRKQPAMTMKRERFGFHNGMCAPMKRTTFCLMENRIWILTADFAGFLMIMKFLTG